jgi:hypothetical protein
MTCDDERVAHQAMGMFFFCFGVGVSLISEILFNLGVSLFDRYLEYDFNHIMFRPQNARLSAVIFLRCILTLSVMVM